MKLIKDDWKDLEGYDGKYRISENGDILDEKTSLLIPARFNQRGYRVVFLSQKGKSKYFLIHRLVYEVFIGEIPENHVLHHIDENIKNNNFRNLLAMKRGEHFRLHKSGERNYNAKFSWDEVREILERSKTESITEIAKSLDQPFHTIRSIVRLETYKLPK